MEYNALKADGCMHGLSFQHRPPRKPQEHAASCAAHRRRWRVVLAAIGVVALGSAAVVWAEDNQARGPAVVLEAVTVTAKRLEDYVKNHPQQVETLSREEIGEGNLRNLEEALNTMAGVEISHSAGLGARISIRGSGKAGGVLVLLNGRPLNTSQYGGVDLAGIPIETVQSISVFKPPVPVWLGPGAANGAIHIVTYDGCGRGTVDDEVPGSLKLSAGSYGLAEGTLSGGAPLAGGNAMLTAGGIHRDGKRTNSDMDRGTVSLHWDHSTAEDLQFNLNGRYYLLEQGTPGPTDNPTPDARQRYAKGSFDLEMKGFTGESGDFSLKAYTDDVDSRDTAQSGSVSDLEELKLGLKGDTTWSDEGGICTLRLGGLVERNDVAHTLSGDHHRVLGGAHAHWERDFGSVTAAVGLRGDHSTDFGFNPGGSCGLGFQLLEKGLVKANAGYTVTLPTFGQLYQPSHGSIDQVRGNPDLDEEQCVSYDLGFDYSFRKGRFLKAALFRNETRNAIVYERGPDRIYRPVNVDRAWRQGMEVAGAFGLDNGLGIEVSYILQDSRNEKAGVELPYTPRHKVRAGFTYTVEGWDTRLEGIVRYVAEQYNSAQALDTQRVKAYATADLKVLQPFTMKKLACEWYLNVENLFDRDYEVHYGYPDDGFRVVSGVNLNF